MANRSYTYFSKERKDHYDQINNSENKQLGDEAEKRVCEYLNSIGVPARMSGSDEDSKSHADIVLRDGTTIDVKCKNSVVIELKNFWGNPGWIFTGADYIYNIVKSGPHKDEMYVYKRQDMVDFIKRCPGLFQEKYCKTYDGKSVLYFFSYNTLNSSSMKFVKCIKL